MNPNHSIVKIDTFIADTDYSGVIYHANYLRYCDYARTQFLKAQGIALERLAADGQHFVVVDLTIDFVKPALLCSQLAITTELTRLGYASMVFTQVVRAWDNLDYRYAEAVVKLALVNNTFKPQRLPADLYHQLTLFDASVHR